MCFVVVVIILISIGILLPATKRESKSLIFSKKAKDELRDSYIKVLLTLQLRCKASELPSELIEVKRKHFQVLQKIKEMTDERQSKNPR